VRERCVRVSKIDIRGEVGYSKGEYKRKVGLR
jgi:hypothetical protein